MSMWTCPDCLALMHDYERQHHKHSHAKPPPRDVTVEYSKAAAASSRWDLAANFGEDKIDLPALRRAYFEHGYVQALIDFANAKGGVE